MRPVEHRLISVSRLSNLSSNRIYHSTIRRFRQKQPTSFPLLLQVAHTVLVDAPEFLVRLLVHITTELSAKLEMPFCIRPNRDSSIQKTKAFPFLCIDGRLPWFSALNAPPVATQIHAMERLTSKPVTQVCGLSDA